MSSLAPRGVVSRGFFPMGTLAAVVAVLLSLSGCHQVVKDPQDPRFIVAEQKDWTITRAQLNDEITAFLKQQQKTIQDVDPSKMPLLETEVLNNMVVKKLILARAAALNFPDVDKEDAKTLEEVKGQSPNPADLDAKLKSAGMTMDDLKTKIHEGTLIRKTMEAEALKNVQPTDAEINAFYLQNKDKLTTPDKIRASRIIIMADDKTAPADRAAKKKAIDKAHARVMKGEDFGKVASEVSEDRYSVPKGGDIGYFQRGENEASFDDVAFSTKPGTVSAVFQTPMGFEFLKVTDVHPGGVVSIAQARDTISRYLGELKQRQAVGAYAKKLIADGGVTFHIVLVDPSQIPGALPAGTQGGAPAPASAQAPAAAPEQMAPASAPSTNGAQ